MTSATMTHYTPQLRSRTSTMLALSLLLLSSISHTAQAQEAEPTVCSCSPTIFTFVLSLNQTCDDNDIESNSGIDGSFCFTEEGVAVPEAPAPDEGLEEESTDDNTRATTDPAPVTGAAPDGPVRMLFRTLQEAADPIVEIVSVQFLEFDNSGDLTVINQDDTYADVSLADGDRLKFNSASSFLDTALPLEEQMASPALVPGGASLILYGKTESGQVIRNRFFWMYDMNCGRENEPIKVDDEIGWVTVGEISNAWPTFCPALPAGSPTIAPKSNEPTLSPSVSPIASPTTSPSISPIALPTTSPETPSPTEGATTSKPTPSPTEGATTEAPTPPPTPEPTNSISNLTPPTTSDEPTAPSTPEPTHPVSLVLQPISVAPTFTHAPTRNITDTPEIPIFGKSHKFNKSSKSAKSKSAKYLSMGKATKSVKSDKSGKSVGNKSGKSVGSKSSKSGDKSGKANHLMGGGQYRIADQRKNGACHGRSISISWGVVIVGSMMVWMIGS